VSDQQRARQVSPRSVVRVAHAKLERARRHRASIRVFECHSRHRRNVRFATAIPAQRQLASWGLIGPPKNLRRNLLRHPLSSITSSTDLQIVLGGTAALHAHRAWGAVLF
jgi:hypothetical protein